jgi:hypothetical protein
MSQASQRGLGAERLCRVPNIKAILHPRSIGAVNTSTKVTLVNVHQDTSDLVKRTRPYRPLGAKECAGKFFPKRK